MSAIMAARVVGCSQVIALDLTESRLALARQLGATHTIKVEKADTPAKTAAVRLFVSAAFYLLYDCAYR